MTDDWEEYTLERKLSDTEVLKRDVAKDKLKEHIESGEFGSGDLKIREFVTDNYGLFLGEVTEQDHPNFGKHFTIGYEYDDAVFPEHA